MEFGCIGIFTVRLFTRIGHRQFRLLLLLVFVVVFRAHSNQTQAIVILRFVSTTEPTAKRDEKPNGIPVRGSIITCEFFELHLIVHSYADFTFQMVGPSPVFSLNAINVAEHRGGLSLSGIGFRGGKNGKFLRILSLDSFTKQCQRFRVMMISEQIARRQSD